MRASTLRIPTTFPEAQAPNRHPPRRVRATRPDCGLCGDEPVNHRTTPPATSTPPATRVPVATLAADFASLRSERPSGLQKLGLAGSHCALESLFFDRACPVKMPDTTSPTTPAPPVTSASVRCAVQLDAGGVVGTRAPMAIVARAGVTGLIGSATTARAPDPAARSRSTCS